MCPQKNYFKHFWRKFRDFRAIFGPNSHYLWSITFQLEDLNYNFFNVFYSKNKILALFYWSEVKQTLKMEIRIINFHDFDQKSKILDISLPDDSI